MRVEVFGLSDTGLKREINQDAYSIYGFKEERRDGFCVVADGMGGHKAGEVASNEAIRIIRDALKKKYNQKDADIRYLLSEAIEAANKTIYDESVSSEDKTGMGTTVVVCCCVGNKLYIANVGDSRAYVLRDKELTQITVDHSITEELVEMGSITREEAGVHPKKHMITRAVGTESGILIDLFEYEIKEGDVVIACTDGLTDMLTDAEIQGILEERNKIEDQVNVLIQRANEKGGLDNITVVGIHFLRIGGEEG